MHAQLYVARPDPIQYHQLQLRPQRLVHDGDFIPRHRPQRLGYSSSLGYRSSLGYSSRSRMKAPFGSDLLLRLPEFSDRRASYSPDFSSFENLYFEPCIQVGNRETCSSSTESAVYLDT